MISTYKSTWIKICQFRVDVEIKNIKQFEDFINFCLSYPDDINPDLQFLIKCIIDYFQEKIHSGIVLYWCGALETSENAIQQIRINNFNKF